MSASEPYDGEGRFDADRLASILIDARVACFGLEPLPAELTPPTFEDARTVDDLVCERSGWPVSGWKIGCTSEHAQQLLGASGPFAGRVYTVLPSGAEVGPTDLPAEPHLEGEFAFTLGTTVEPGDGPARRVEVAAAVADIRPAIEVVGGRFLDFFGTPLPLLMADGGANTLLVLGEPSDSVDPTALAAVEATMTVDGERTGAGTGADVLGDPLDALCWLVDHLGGRGVALEAGQVVTTGTATQVSTLPPGSTAVAELAGIGTVELRRAR